MEHTEELTSMTTFIEHLLLDLPQKQMAQVQKTSKEIVFCTLIMHSLSPILFWNSNPEPLVPKIGCVWI